MPEFPKLSSLTLIGWSFPPDALSAVSSLPNLTSLELPCNFSESHSLGWVAALENFVNLTSLRVLAWSLAPAPLAEQQCASLAQLSSLQELSLGLPSASCGSTTTHVLLELVFSGLAAQLHTLRFNSHRRIVDPLLRELRSIAVLTQLRDLDLANFSDLSSLEVLAELPLLRSLKIRK